MSYTITDKRGQPDLPSPARCRVCGSPHHEQDYNKPAMECIQWLRDEIRQLNAETYSLRKELKQYKLL